MPFPRDRRVFFTLDKPVHDKITAENLSQSAINILAKKLISDYFNESKIDSQKESLEILIKQQKLLRDQNANELHQIKKRNLEADTQIKEYHAAHLGVVGPAPTLQAKKAMGYHIGTKSADKNAIYCPDCTWHTNSADSIQYQIDRVTDHIKLAHNRFFTDKEAQTISEMLR